MTKFHFNQGKSTNTSIVLQDRANGALVLASEVDGDRTIMLCIPYAALNSMFVASLVTDELSLTPMTASFDSFGVTIE